MDESADGRSGEAAGIVPEGETPSRAPHRHSVQRVKLSRLAPVARAARRRLAPGSHRRHWHPRCRCTIRRRYPDRDSLHPGRRRETPWPGIRHRSLRREATPAAGVLQAYALDQGRRRGDGKNHFPSRTHAPEASLPAQTVRRCQKKIFPSFPTPGLEDANASPGRFPVGRVRTLRTSPARFITLPGQEPEKIPFFAVSLESIDASHRLTGIFSRPVQLFPLRPGLRTRECAATIGFFVPMRITSRGEMQ